MSWPEVRAAMRGATLRRPRRLAGGRPYFVPIIRPVISFCRRHRLHRNMLLGRPAVLRVNDVDVEVAAAVIGNVEFVAAVALNNDLDAVGRPLGCQGRLRTIPQLPNVAAVHVHNVDV